jgi:hypothetical protein
MQRGQKNDWREAKLSGVKRKDTLYELWKTKWRQGAGISPLADCLMTIAWLMTELPHDLLTFSSIKYFRVLAMIFFPPPLAWVPASNHNWHCFPHNPCSVLEHCLLKALQNGCCVIISLRPYRAFPLGADWAQSVGMACSITQIAYASRHFSEARPSTASLSILSIVHKFRGRSRDGDAGAAKHWDYFLAWSCKGPPLWSSGQS